jgi:predicted  nucleic acid-binding Zn-ribbon protein
MEKADKEIRDRVTGGGYTDEEARALARAKNNQAEIAKVIAARDKRLVDAYRIEVTAFRAQIPELRAEYDKKMEAYAEFRKQIDRCNETDGSSRSVTDASLRATAQLETIEQAVLNVQAKGLDRIEENPRRNFSEIIQTIDLLFELLPKRLQKPAASGATK